MSDLVERLRGHIFIRGYNKPLYNEAADRIEKLEAIKESTDDVHKAILNLEGSEGMTDAKFVQWVIFALSSLEDKP